MACTILNIATTKFELQNLCAVAPFDEKVDITPYINQDVTSEYGDEVTETTKTNSRYIENYVNSFSLEFGFSMDLKVGTYISQYFQYLATEKKSGNLEVMNNFILTITTPYLTEVYYNVYMNLTNDPFTNIEEKKYTIEFMLHANGTPIPATNPNLEILDNPATLDLNLLAVASVGSNPLTQFDVSFDADANSIEYTAMKLTITQGLNSVEEIFNGTTGMYTTLNELDTSLPASFKLEAIEKGYSQLYTVGTYEYTPLP